MTTLRTTYDDLATALSERLAGEVISPDHPAYDEARRSGTE